MLKQYLSNMDLICDLFKQIYNQKNTQKISFQNLNDMFDTDLEETKLVERLVSIVKNDNKYILSTVLLLMLQDSFEYFIKYEDKYKNIKDTLLNNKSVSELAQALKEDMWPFCPFFQEALTLFAKISYPDIFKEIEDLQLVFESAQRELVFYDSDGVIPITFDNFFDSAKEFIEFVFENKNTIINSKNITFHDITDISLKLDELYQMFTYDFLEPYTNLKIFLETFYNELISSISSKSVVLLTPEINATYKYTKDKIASLRFDILQVKNLDTLEKLNEEVNDLKLYSVTRFNEFSDFINNNKIESGLDSFYKLDKIIDSTEDDGIENLYNLIDEKIKVLEEKYEYKKRLRLIKDLSIKIKNFYEFLIGVKTEIGDMSYISKRQMANFKSKDMASFLLKRLKIQKEAYFKNVHVFDYLSMSHDIKDADFKIYKREDFDNIVSLIKTMEKFLGKVLLSLLPEEAKENEADFENEGRKLDIFGNDINVMLLNEDFSELDFSNDDSHNFNIYDYNAYHNLVDYAVEARRQPVFQDYGDISEYPYFKPFSYQVDSVRTMLQRFEGRGVFGDQVGLGKTLEALMCADVMFRCATIKNAVIVTTKQTIRQWRNEALTKFRHEDGTPMFEVYPKHDSYSFRELMKELLKDKKTKDSNALKIYLVSTEQIKSKDTIDFIKETGSYFGLKNAAYSNMPFEDFDTKVIDTNIQEIQSFKHLDILEKRLPLELSHEIKESLDKNEAYKKITSFNVYGFFEYEYDSKLKTFNMTNSNLYDPDNKNESSVLNEINLLKIYSKKMQEISDRRQSILTALDRLKENYSYADKRLVDLLIFDEVQDLLYDFNNKDASEALLQEFIANIQKKYCILISATPIKNDLSDIFNLLYMVDKNRLGDTKEKALNKFYNAYCGGAKSLAEMAKSKDAKTKFMKLNGLINSMFTRKRLYDSDVIESIRRHSATKEEMEYAKKFGRDDYGGQAFMKLVGVIRRAKMALEEDNYMEFIDKYIYPLFPKYKMSYEIYKDAFIKLSDYVNEAANICVKRLESELRIKLKGFNVFDKLNENYKIILKQEQEDNLDDVYNVSVKTCNLLTSYINRGILEFYRSYQEYPTVFLSDYIDWRRPRKRGEKIYINELKDKVEIFKDILTINDYKFKKYDINPTNLDALEAGKILFYEKDSKIRSEIYNNIKEIGIKNNNRRRVYMALNQADEAYYKLDDFIHFSYFPKGRAKDEMSKYIESLNNKDNLTYDDSRLKEAYTVKGTLLKNEIQEDTYQGLSFKNFTNFSANNENWNSIYFIDKTMIEGTDFNAANILIIGQLDNKENKYLDPLELEQLIGRISRMGQTEECIVFTCLYNGDFVNVLNNKDFNDTYYDILTDEKGFDLYGVCQTEVDFVMPVILALAKRVFAKEYISSDANNIAPDEFIASYKNGYIEYIPNKFPDLVKYLCDNKDNIIVYFNGNTYNAIDALKEMIRVYSGILSPEKRK